MSDLEQNIILAFAGMLTFFVVAVPAAWLTKRRQERQCQRAKAYRMRTQEGPTTCSA